MSKKLYNPSSKSANISAKKTFQYSLFKGTVQRDFNYVLFINKSLNMTIWMPPFSSLSYGLHVYTVCITVVYIHVAKNKNSKLKRTTHLLSNI
jgi:hypothetical protein